MGLHDTFHQRTMVCGRHIVQIKLITYIAIACIISEVGCSLACNNPWSRPRNRSSRSKRSIRGNSIDQLDFRRIFRLGSTRLNAGRLHWPTHWRSLYPPDSHDVRAEL